ncbi:MAG: lipocalin-like domain-containing protein [Pseudomonadota bacterium]|jgi:hypothetical protein
MPAFSPLTFDVRNPAIRSAREEWKPHARMSEKSYEWWYVTAHAQDSSGRSYFLFFDLVNYPGDGWQKRFGQEPVDGHRFVHLVGMLSDYDGNDYRQLYEFGYLPDDGLWSEDDYAVQADVGNARAWWTYREDYMELRAEFEDVHLDLRLDNSNEILWHKDKLGIEGMIQQGAEDDFSFYYSIPRAPMSGRLSIRRADGSWRDLMISGSTPLLCGRTAMPRRPRSAHGCPGAGAMNSRSRLRAPAISGSSPIVRESSWKSRRSTTRSMRAPVA